MDNIVIDERDIQGMISILRRTVSDLSPAMKEIGEHLVGSIQDNFRAGGRYGRDTPYNGGSAHWIPSQEVSRDSGVTLTESGDLSDSVFFDVLGQDRLAIGLRSSYGAIHHFGGYAGRNRSVHIPERPIIAIQQRDLDMIEHTVGYYIFVALSNQLS